MSVLDIESLLREVGPESPTGEDLEYDPGFIEMEALASTGGDQSMIEGAEQVEAHVVDWKAVREKSLELLARSKDLRVAVYLVRSSIVCDGLAGFAEGLQLLHGLLERFWDQVHPQLDPSDDNDPTMRINTIAALSSKPETLDLLVSAPLVSSRQVGDFCFRDVQIATGVLSAPVVEKSAPTIELISAACLDCELEDLQSTAGAIVRSLEQTRAIDQLLTERVASTQAPDLQPLMHTLVAMNRFVADKLTERGVSGHDTGDGAGGNPEPASAPGQQHSATGQILSRADAMRMMDKISEYFQAHEPSSPIPLLMLRAKRLATMDFLSIIKDLAPDGTSQVENIAGSNDAGGSGK